MVIKEFKFESATGVCTISGARYTPDDGAVEKVVVIHHGMAEHSGRYQEFIKFLTENGFAVFMHDMANHGSSNQNAIETGYFGETDGDKALIKDLKTVYDLARREYPDKKIIVMGHSMGSFVVRCFTAQFNTLDYAGVIYMGTGGSNPLAGIGLALANMVIKTKGPLHKSKLIDKMTFGSYGKRTEGRTASDWLTKNEAVVDAYVADEMCGFIFSAAGMRDLVKLNVAANSDEWYEKVPKELPILLISGAEDPVSEYGKGIHEIDEKLTATGHVALTTKLYDGDRHEVLNELDKETVYADILAWLKAV